MIRRPDAHIIETEAQHLFEGSLPKEWVARKTQPDYSLDYSVEIFSSGAATGVTFDVQLKGSRAPRYRDSTLLLPFSTEKLTHYVRERVLPVIIVVVDVTQSRVLWISADEAVDAIAQSNPDWQRQETVTLRIPGDRLLPASIGKLEADIRAMVGSLRALAKESGCLLFSHDDYCFLADNALERLGEFDLEVQVRLLNKVKFIEPFHEPLISFCYKEWRPGREKESCKYWFRGVVELWKLQGNDGDRISVITRADGKSKKYEGPLIRSGLWETILVGFRDHELSIAVNTKRICHTLSTRVETAPVLLIGVRFLGEEGLSHGLKGAIRRVRLRKVAKEEDFALWTFPRVDPGLDVSGHGRYLSLPGRDLSRSASTTSDPLHLSLTELESNV